MKASDLRIGNKINYEGFESTVIGLTTDDSVRIRYYESTVKIIECTAIIGWDRNIVGGIPLSEEWLLRFGLKSHNLENGFYGGECVGHYSKSDGGYYFVVDANDDGYGGFNYTTTEIEFVHELQNLYFFWNKEELLPKTC